MAVLTFKSQYNHRFSLMLHYKLATAAQTAYASIISATRQEDLRTVAELPGSVSKKIVKKRKYWYYQTADLTGK